MVVGGECLEGADAVFEDLVAHRFQVLHLHSGLGFRVHDFGFKK